MNMDDYMKRLWEASLKTAAYFEEGRYTDKDGVLWLGVEGESQEEDRWFRQDTKDSITSKEMQKKIGYELMGWDEPQEVEDPYEYAMATGKEGKPVGDLMDRYNKKPVWTDRDSAESLVKFYTNEFQHEEFKLVKRRKAGKVQDV